MICKKVSIWYGKCQAGRHFHPQTIENVSKCSWIIPEFTHFFNKQETVLYKCCSSIAWYALTSCTSSCAENSSLGFKNYITLLFPCQSYIETINLKFLINKLIYCFKYILYNAPPKASPISLLISEKSLCFTHFLSSHHNRSPTMPAGRKNRRTHNIFVFFILLLALSKPSTLITKSHLFSRPFYLLRLYSSG